MSYTYASRRRGGGLAMTTVLAAKVAFASAVVAAIASFARIAVPQLVSTAGAFLSKLCLFAAVHVIIFVIWKLSDNKHFQAAQHKDPWAPGPHAEDVVVPEAVKPKEEFVAAAVVSAAVKPREQFVAAAVKPKEEFVTAPAVKPRDHFITAAVKLREEVVAAADVKPREQFVAAAVKPREWFVAAGAVKPREQFVAVATEYGVSRLAPEASPEKEISPDSGGGESCVTTESDEDAPSAAFYIADTKRSLAPAKEYAVLERKLSSPSPAIAATYVDCAGVDNDDDDDLDATWNAIMQKTRPAAASPPAKPTSPPRRPRARDPSVGAEELNKRSEDFIKKIHNSFGRQ